MKIKNYILTMMKALALTAMTVGLVNCSKDNGNSNTVNTNASSYRCFQMSNNTQVPNSYCYNNTTTQGVYQCRDLNNYQVANNLCANTGTTNGYSYNQYGQCVQTSTGQQVPQNYCTSGVGGGSVVSCQGQTFFWQGIQITCGVTYNCPSGVVLQNQQGQTVQCM